MKSFKDWLLLAMGLTLAGLLAFVFLGTRSPLPGGTSKVDGVALGRAYAPVVISTLGDGWNAAADTLAAGKTVNEAQAVLQESWKSARASVFNAKVAPSFSRVLPEATEPKDDAQRAAVVSLWREFARGVKGGR